MFSKLSGLETGSPIVVPTGLCPGFLSPARPDAISPVLGGGGGGGPPFADGGGGGGGPPFVC